MKKILIASVIALTVALVGASVNASFDRNLSVGSTGADVTALQTWLMDHGFDIAPISSGAASKGYFGQSTKAAVVAYQASVSVPTTGFVGPLTRAALNGSPTVSTGMTLPFPCPTGYTAPAGWVCPGTTTGGTGTGITTVGYEGTIIVTKDSSGIKTTAYEGDTMVPLLGFKVEAKDSDMAVQRVNVNLGTDTSIYTRVIKALYLVDSTGKTVASRELNSSTVSRDSSVSPARYYVALAGFSSVVPKGAKQTYAIKADLFPSVSDSYRGTKTLALMTNGVRAIDGLGIDQYAADTNTQSFTISRSLADSATLTLSSDPNIVKAATVIADQGSNTDERDSATIGSFRVLAEKDNVLVRDLTLSVTASRTGATVPTAYLYDGSTQIASASVSSSTATSVTYAFTSIDQLISRDATKTYTVKVDVRSATTTANNVVLSTVAVSSAESSSGNTVTVSNLTVGGETQAFVSKGASVAFVSSTIETISKAAADTASGSAEASLTGTFYVRINAVGADAVFGTASSSFTFKLLKQGSDVTSAASTSYVVYYPSTQPTGTTGYSSTGFTVPRNAEVVIPVTYKVTAVGTTTINSVLPSGNYAVKLNTITYTSGGTSISNDNSTNSTWVTAEKAL